MMSFLVTITLLIPSSLGIRIDVVSSKKGAMDYGLNVLS